MNGWIKFHRQMMEHPVWGLSEGQFKVWVTCLALANHKPGEWWDGQQRVEIPAGAFVTSQPHLAEMAKVGRIVVRHALSNLRVLGSIRAKIQAKRWTLVEIVNWPTYQGGDDEVSQEMSPGRAKVEPSASHNGRMKEGKKEKKELFAGDSAPAGARASTKRARGNGKATDPNVNLVIEAYHQGFLERHGSPPPIQGGKCGAIAKTMLRGRPPAEAVWVVREFFKAPPPFYRDKGLWGLEHVLAAMPTLLARKGELERGL